VRRSWISTFLEFFQIAPANSPKFGLVALVVDVKLARTESLVKRRERRDKNTDHDQSYCGRVEVTAARRRRQSRTGHPECCGSQGDEQEPAKVLRPLGPPRPQLASVALSDERVA